jgi:hypothetical protein
MFDKWLSDNTLLLFDYFKEKNASSYSANNKMPEV